MAGDDNLTGAGGKSRVPGQGIAVAVGEKDFPAVEVAHQIKRGDRQAPGLPAPRTVAVAPDA